MVTRFPNYIMPLLLALYFWGCSHREKSQTVDLSETIELNQATISEGPALNVCIGSMITPEEGYAYYKKLLDYIGKKLNLKVNFVDTRTYSEANSLLKNNSIDMAFVCGGPYVEGRDDFGLELLCAPQVGGKTVYYSYIIVGKNSGIEKFEDLRGKKFAFVDPMSNTGKLAPVYMLKKEFGETPDVFFNEYLYTYDHDKSIKAVAHGIVDGAAVDSLVWDYMDKKNDEHTKETRIIKISEPYGIPPVVVRPGLELTTEIKQVLLNMHKENEGREILSGMFIDRFVEIDDSTYDGIRRLKTFVEK